MRGLVRYELTKYQRALGKDGDAIPGPRDCSTCYYGWRVASKRTPRYEGCPFSDCAKINWDTVED